MLVLTRKEQEVIRIGDDIRIIIVEFQHGKVRIGIEAPANVPVHREEIWERIKSEGRRNKGPEGPG